MKQMAISLDPVTTKALVEKAAGDEIIERGWDLEKLSEEVLDPAPSLIMVGLPPEGQTSLEMAQLLRMNYPEAAIFHVTPDRKSIDSKAMEKNGFNAIYVVPFEIPALHDAVIAHRSKMGSAQKSYKQVKLVDVAPGTTLEFDTSIFLPMNGKYILFSAAGQELDEERAKRLQTHKIKSVYVERGQMKKFYQYTAERLKTLSNQTGQISETERKERLQNSVRELFGGLFEATVKEDSFKEGKEMAKDCQEIVKAYISSSKTDQKSSWYEKFLEIAENSSEAYSRATNVSTYAGLFSIGLGIGDSEHVAMAGLLQDIGKADLPSDLQAKHENDMNEEEKKVYCQYPQLTVSLIKNRKMAVPEPIMKIILQHRERYDGSGFPNGLKGSKILPEAQLISIANDFNSLTAVIPGQPRVTPVQAVKIIKDSMATDPSKMHYDPELLTKVLRLFPEQAEEAAPVAA